jgi:hypothetical protein
MLIAEFGGEADAPAALTRMAEEILYGRQRMELISEVVSKGRTSPSSAPDRIANSPTPIRIVSYQPVSRSTELSAIIRPQRCTSSHPILLRATELGSKMVASGSRNVGGHAVICRTPIGALPRPQRSPVEEGA